MLNFDELSIYAKANYSWDEILRSADFRVESTEELKNSDGKAITWVNEQGPKPVRLMTTAEDLPAFDISSLSVEKPKLSKLELIRILHAGNNWKVLETLVSTGTPLFHGDLAELGRLRRDIDLFDDSSLSPDERLAFDPAFQQLVARKRIDLEAGLVARKQLEDIEATTFSRQFDGMSESEQSDFLGFVDWKSLWDDESVERWYIPNFICEGRAHSFYAASGLGKSLLMLEACAGLAAGKSVFGFEPQNPITVLYIDNENTPKGDVKPRLKAMGYEHEDLSNLKYLSFPNFNPLNSKAGGEAIIKVLDLYNPQLLVLDTFSRFLEGDENQSMTAQTFYNWTGKVLKKRGIAYVRIDHMGKNPAAETRGSSAKKDDVDLVWLMKEVEADSKFQMLNEKARVGITSASYYLVREHEPLKHRVLNGLDWSHLAELAARPEKALGLIEERMENNPKAKLGKTVVWNELQDTCKSLKITRQTLWDAIARYRDGERTVKNED